MRDLRWTVHRKGTQDCHDDRGVLRGTITPLVDGGGRAVVIKGDPGDLDSWLNGTSMDHPTEAAARAWVEGEAKAGGADA